ncbi:MAG: hypothetical protein P8P48_11205 [Saprospiraceae bacterium]|nr:hypothetical protein [Saprospiraceae bacterium]
MRRLFTALFIVFCFAACKTDDTFIFEIPYGPLEFSVPPGVSVLNYHQFTIPMDAQTILDFVSQGQSYSEIVPNVAVIQSLALQQDLSFARDISVTICLDGETDPNCGMEIFWKNPTDFDETTPSNLWANENDISELLESGDVVIKVKFSQLRSTTLQELNLILNLQFIAR